MVGRRHLIYTIVAAALVLLVDFIGYPRIFGLADIVVSAVLIGVAVWAALAYDRGRLDRYTIGLLVVMGIVLAQVIISLSLSPHSLFMVVLGMGILMGYLVFGALYYLGRRRGLRLSDINMCSLADRRVLYASMLATLLVIVVVGGVAYALLAYWYRARLGHCIVWREAVDWVIILISIYAAYRLMEWSVEKCATLKRGSVGHGFS